ncbi:MAG: agmatinase [Magnetococcales bacterium]|nr:agmatinase [Magnetococcales bacterium]
MRFANLEEPPPEQARVTLLPIPYGNTLTYGKGAAKGPEALLRASGHMELFDETLLQETYRIGFHTRPLLPSHPDGPEAMQARIYKAATTELNAGRFLAAIGGEHGITPALVRAHRDHFGSELSVLQIDAHADLRERYDDTQWSHACVMRRIYDLGLPFVQVGLRSLSLEEWHFIRDQDLMDRIYWARDIVPQSRGGDHRWMDELVARLADRVYISFDLDGLDPSVMPATGTPEPGGLDYHMAVELMARVFAQREVVGLDLVELAPIEGQPASDFSAARLLYRMLGYRFPLT